MLSITSDRLYQVQRLDCNVSEKSMMGWRPTVGVIQFSLHTCVVKIFEPLSALDHPCSQTALFLF